MRTAVPLTLVVPGAPALVLVGGIIALIEWGAAPKPPATTSISDLLAQGAAWSPTRDLAEEAATQLGTVAGNRAITTSPSYVALAVDNRSATWHMENWYRPIRAWYAEETAHYRKNAIGGDTVVEVGLLNYEWHTNRLVVQVMMRLVDVETGQVVGRTRNWAIQKSVGLPSCSSMTARG